jgi:hypothetical protein
VTGLKRAAAAILLVAVSGTATSGATFTASSSNQQTLATATDFGLHVALTDPGSPLRGTVTVAATASDSGGGTVARVEVQRAPAGSGTWTTICADIIAPYSCALDTTALADGAYDLRARATSSTGYARASTVVANRLIDNAAPSVTMTDPGAWFRGTLALASTASDGAGGSGVASVRYEYRQTGTGAWATACTATAAPFSCSFDAGGLTNGTGYDFRAVAADGAGNETASAAVTDRRADSAAPAATLDDPGATLRGTVTLSGTATDAHSGVASARFQVSPAGSDTWSDACVDTSSPYSCAWDTTTVASGLYDVRVLATDVPGNTAASTVAGRRVDNVLPLTSFVDPGSPLSGTVTLTATASDTGGSGVASVRLQYSASGTGAWNDICTDTASPYSCAANTTGVADALYDFRSIATDVAGNAGTSATVAARRVDNLVPSGSDVQTGDGGGTPGVIQTGDWLRLTYSEAIDPASIVAGWSGTGSQSVHVRFTHHNQGDRVMIYNAANTAALPLAAGSGVVLDADYLASSATFAGTLTTTGSTFTVTLGARTAGAVNATAPGAGTMTWSPSNGARDFVGKACSTTNRTESGAADAEF